MLTLTHLVIYFAFYGAFVWGLEALDAPAPVRRAVQIIGFAVALVWTFQVLALYLPGRLRL